MRLTNDLRQRVANAIVAQTFEGKRVELKAAEAELFRRAAIEAFGAELLDALQALPAGWVPEVGGLDFSNGGLTPQRVFLAGATIRIPHSAWSMSRPNTVKLNPASAIWKAVSKHGDAKEGVRTASGAMLLKFHFMLGKVSTVAGLLKVMPEAEPVVSKILGNTHRAPTAEIYVDEIRRAAAAAQPAKPALALVK